MTTRLRKLLEAEGFNHPIQDMIRRPVSIHMSLEDIKRYMDEETRDYLIFQWAKAYVDLYEQKIGIDKDK